LDNNYNYDEKKIPEYVSRLNTVLKLKPTVTAMKFYEKREEMEAVPKIRIPKEGELFTTCQLIAQTTRLNFTIGFCNEHLPTLQCSGVCSFIGKNDFKKARHLTGAWYATNEDTFKHQNSMYLMDKIYEAVAISPAILGRLKEPDVILVYGLPEQIMFIACALQYDDYKPMGVSFVGESSCSDSWVRACVTGKPCFTIPCFGERRFGGVLEDELVMAFPPEYLPKILDGLDHLFKNGMKYPASQYGIQNDVRIGMSAVYDLETLQRPQGSGV